ncbi:MFS transporter [Variovorax ginsengisoli]|uniref:MFS family arabinose efflux permease n=1 Tax=Variovorax ginsengisoli TaxID=363844 RepID=A0ABT9SB12_9BURK|nr:MFS transporter [Variovorax ginsengisoli]MDP9901541.1 putative MFS family arabinose efflux permease [Variovorax ginsengisoli]
MKEALCPSMPESVAPQERASLPLGGLLALAAAGFLTILTEALPAGLLPSMAASLDVSQALVGQLVTVYALGSLLAAIPLVAATRGWRRRPLLLAAVGGFALVNTVTALSTQYGLTLAARFLAGMFAGLLWALLAGQASRMVAPALRGRAIAVAMLGAPVALSLGIPAGTWLGGWLGWQATFGALSVLSVLLLGWVRATVPDFPGASAARQTGLRQVLALPGLCTVLGVLLAFVLAHNLLYTYIAPFLAQAGMAARIDVLLLVFGCASLVGIWLTALLIDRWLRALALAGIGAFGAAALVLALASDHPPTIIAGMAVWGVAFGGTATLFQTAAANAADGGPADSADVAQSLLVTAWNLAMALGGLAGGWLLADFGAQSLPWAPCLLLAFAGWGAWRGHQHGFARRT